MTRVRKAIIRSVWRSACILFLGCAQIFAIDEACVLGGDNCEPCVDYCNTVSAECAGAPQYDDMRPTECLTLCRHLPRSEGATRGNNFECRLAQTSTSSGEQIDCQAAGRGGGGRCGTNCDAYCSLMEALCPVHFDEFSDVPADAAADSTACMAICERLETQPDFDPSTGGRDENDEGSGTVQCRLWHLGSAAMDFEGVGPNNSHCDHAVAVGHCLPPALR